MKKFVLLQAALFFIISTGIYAGRIYGALYTSDNPLEKIGISICSDRPCWNGVIPSITSVYEAEAKVNHFENYEKGGTGMLFQLDAYIGVAFFNAVESGKISTIDEIEFNFVDIPNVNVQALVQYFGPPCEVTYKTYLVILKYPHLYAELSTISGKKHTSLDMDWPLNQVVLTDNLDLCSDKLDSSEIPNVPWRGFASLWRYESNQP
jgi:hypothetical protein